MKKSKVLVTGATGFVGKNVMQALMARDDVEVIAACRDASKLPASFGGETRLGDMMDVDYCRSVVRDIDVVCHAASWASLWGHHRQERERFYLPACRLIDAAVEQGVRRFILTSTVAINSVNKTSASLGDLSVTEYVNYWPHLNMLIDVDHYMRACATPTSQMVVLRLGTFIGRGNRLGLLPALVPRLKTHLVPWLDGGRKRMPLLTDTDLGQAFALAAVATHLNDYESFNICGKEFPHMRDVLNLIAQETGAPLPHFSVPYSVGYAFGRLMEALNPVLPGSPFLTRSIVHLSEEWVAPNDYATAKLGYMPQKDWRTAVREQLAELKAAGYPWLPLHQ